MKNVLYPSPYTEYPPNHIIPTHFLRTTCWNIFLWINFANIKKKRQILRKLQENKSGFAFLSCVWRSDLSINALRFINIYGGFFYPALIHFLFSPRWNESAHNIAQEGLLIWFWAGWGADEWNSELLHKSKCHRRPPHAYAADWLTLHIRRLSLTLLFDREHTSGGLQIVYRVVRKSLPTPHSPATKANRRWRAWSQASASKKCVWRLLSSGKPHNPQHTNTNIYPNTHTHTHLKAQLSAG